MAESGEVPEDRGSDRAATPASSTAPLPSPSASTAPFDLDISSFTYTPFYCEENVYLLCKKLCTIEVADPTGNDLFVAFISNEEKKVPVWYQKASKRTNGLMLWDYHVICIQRDRESNGHPLVWDLDSCLPFPCPLDQYFAEAIRPLLFLSSRYRRLFRVVHAPMFLRFFASDRGHMKDSEGNWISLPPKYEPIIAEDGTMNNFNEYIQMHASDAVTNLEDFIDGVYSNKYGVVEYVCSQLARSLCVRRAKIYGCIFQPKAYVRYSSSSGRRAIICRVLMKQKLSYHCVSCSIAFLKQDGS